MAQAQKIAKVVVDAAIDREFDYEIPDALLGNVRLGSRVSAPFGARSVMGYVVGFCERSERPQLKTLEALAGDKPLLSERSIELARWISAYYASTIETAIKSALPCAVRRRGAGFLEQLYVRPAPENKGAAQNGLSAKQSVVMTLLAARGGMTLTDLVSEAGCTESVARTLQRKGLVLIEPLRLERNPFENKKILPTAPPVLMQEQADALETVCRSIDTLQPPVVLLHGVTGSGKTEVYLRAIRHALDKGLGAITLVPEISLTPQTVERFRARFGDMVAVLHSRLSDGERHDEWHRLLDGAARIAIGARSALFAPVPELGLIIVDEEHEPSYKQSESPRYHARDVAVMRGRIERCSVLLGSASPAFESYHNAMSGKYALAVLPGRVDHRPMPRMLIVDMRVEAARVGRLNVFSQALLDAVRARLENSEQVMLFLNRRGYSASLQCPLCGHVAMCDMCSIAMTYHRHDERLKCHLCGSELAAPMSCPECGNQAIRFAGLGTQRVEEAARALFPNARIRRMDMDTTRGKNSHGEILDEFKLRKTDILIGTQMIAKGLHFPGVTLVGVINADTSLHMPDFRAAERTFQLLVQVAGRAGRGEIPGEVIVQTFTPDHAAVQAAEKLDYEGFYAREIEFRKQLSYPPFSRLVCITLDGADESKTRDAADRLAGHLRAELPQGSAIAGPLPAPVSKIKGRNRFQLMLRVKSALLMKGTLKDALRRFAVPRSINVAADVDALSVM